MVHPADASYWFGQVRAMLGNMFVFRDPPQKNRSDAGKFEAEQPAQHSDLLQRRKVFAAEFPNHAVLSHPSRCKRPHAIYISLYDATKRVWVVDVHTHAIYIFSNDGKQLLQTIGTPNVPGADGTHFNRPTFMAAGRDLLRGRRLQRHARWEVRRQLQVHHGLRQGRRSREGDPARLYEQRAWRCDRRADAARLRQRSHHRIRIFDENGKYLSEWRIAVRPSSLHYVIIGADRTLLTFDRNTHKAAQA